MINRTTNTNTPSTDWTFLIHEINEQTKRSERRLTIAIELAILRSEERRVGKECPM